MQVFTVLSMACRKILLSSQLQIRVQQKYKQFHQLCSGTSTFEYMILVKNAMELKR